MMLRFFLSLSGQTMTVGRTEEIRALDQISRVLIYIHIMHIYIEKWVKEERVLADNKPASSKAKIKLRDYMRRDHKNMKVFVNEFYRFKCSQVHTFHFQSLYHTMKISKVK